MSSFRYDGPADDRAFHLAFDKDRADERKTWMLDFRYPLSRVLRARGLAWLGPARSDIARTVAPLFFQR